MAHGTPGGHQWNPMAAQSALHLNAEKISVYWTLGFELGQLCVFCVSIVCMIYCEALKNKCLIRSLVSYVCFAGYPAYRECHAS